MIKNNESSFEQFNALDTAYSLLDILNIQEKNELNILLKNIFNYEKYNKNSKRFDVKSINHRKNKR